MIALQNSAGDLVPFRYMYDVSIRTCATFCDHFCKTSLNPKEISQDFQFACRGCSLGNFRNSVSASRTQTSATSLPTRQLLRVTPNRSNFCWAAFQRCRQSSSFLLMLSPGLRDTPSSSHPPESLVEDFLEVGIEVTLRRGGGGVPSVTDLL